MKRETEEKANGFRYSLDKYGEFKTTEITLCNGENALINIYFIYQNLQIGN
jgi:hypothetical protein